MRAYAEPLGVPAFLVSPLKAIIHGGVEYGAEQNIRLAHDLALELSRCGLAPFAPHGYYTAFLDDQNPAERRIGMKAGEAWLREAKVVVVYTGRGISQGMLAEIELAASLGKRLFFFESLDGIARLVERVMVALPMQVVGWRETTKE